MSIPNEHKSYLGDGVYVEWDGYDFIVFTTNGIARSNVIYFDADMIQDLAGFAERRKAKSG